MSPSKPRSIQHRKFTVVPLLNQNPGDATDTEHLCYITNDEDMSL